MPGRTARARYCGPPCRLKAWLAARGLQDGYVMVPAVRCAWPPCGELFAAKRAGHIYHAPECRKAAGRAHAGAC